MIDKKILIADKILSTYCSAEDNLRAQTFLDKNNNYGVRFFKENVWITDELYEGHSEVYAENAAENYVLGVKHLSIRS